MANPKHRTAQKDRQVKPLSGLAPWVGGKCNMAKVIVERIEQIKHICYCEPFVGMGGVFFRRRKMPDSEVINDRAGEVVNLFRVIKHHPDALIDTMR